MAAKILTPDSIKFYGFTINDFDDGRVIELKGHIIYKDSNNIETRNKARIQIKLDEASDADKAIINAMINLGESKIKADVDLE
jgi:hypothetical protein